MCSTSSRSPWLAAKGQVEKCKNVWASANSRNWSVMVYDPVEVSGHFVPPQPDVHIK
jgi:hypothetical protein